MNLLTELRRRNVTRAAAAYAALGWLLIQIGDATLDAFGFDASAQRILIIALAIGFGPAMVLAWVFEITPEGLRREEEMVRDESLRRRTNRVMDRLVTALLALALGYFAVDKFLLSPAREKARIEAATALAAEQATMDVLRDVRGERTIAVLPFENLSSDSEQEYFSDGVAEEVLNLLAKIPGLSVTSRTSAFVFKGKQAGIADIAKQLGVVYVLEGSVRKAGERVRITAQLIDARTDTHLWSETYDRTLEDVFAVQDDVAAKVVGELQLKLLSDLPRTRRANPLAHEHMLRARQLMSSWVIEDTAAAAAELRQAIALDPEYAEAYALLADALVIGAPSSDFMPRSITAAVPLIEKALALDPSLGEAWVTRGILEGDATKAEMYVRRGLELNPSYARGWEILADQISQQAGRAQEALESIDRARTLDPLLPRNDHIKAYILAEQFGDFDGARALWRQALVANPRFRSALAGLGSLDWYTGDYANAVALYERALAIDPQAEFVRDSLVNTYLLLGDLEAAESVDQSSPGEISWSIVMAQGNWTEAAARLSALGPQARREIHPNVVAEIALHGAAGLGGIPQARDTLAAALDFTGSLPAQVSYLDIGLYVALAQLMRSAGDETAARQVLDGLLPLLDIEGKRAAGVPNNIDTQRAFVLAHLGDIDGALRVLERATTPAPSAWVMPLRRDHPLFAPLASEPRFQAIMDRVEAHVAHQRELLQQMRSRGEVPARRGR